MDAKRNKGTYKPNTAMSEDAFRHKFRSEKIAREYLEKERWAGKPKCSCGSTKTHAWRKDRPGYYRCKECGKQFCVKIGTIFENSHIPLRKWLIAWYYIVTDRKGISTVALSKKLGITQKSAWLLESKIRLALSDGNHDFILRCTVEIDETYVGGREKNKHSIKKLRQGSGPVGKTAIFGIKERRGNGRAIAMVVPDVTRETLVGKLKEHVKRGTIVNTDEARQYIGLERHGFAHRSVNHSAKQFVDGNASTNGVESMWALLKRGFYGTYHKFSLKHLSGYVGEFNFRWNGGSCKHPTMDRINALAGCCWGKTASWKSLTGELSAG